MLKVVHDAETSNEDSTDGADTAGGSLLDEIVRDGARQMLAAALQAEVSAYIDAHADEVDEHGHRLVVRNGHHQPREVTTSSGAVPVRQPRVNDQRAIATATTRRGPARAVTRKRRAPTYDYDCLKVLIEVWTLLGEPREEVPGPDHGDLPGPVARAR